MAMAKVFITVFNFVIRLLLFWSSEVKICRLPSVTLNFVIATCVTTYCNLARLNNFCGYPWPMKIIWNGLNYPTMKLTLNSSDRLHRFHVWIHMYHTWIIISFYIENYSWFTLMPLYISTVTISLANLSLAVLALQPHTYISSNTEVVVCISTCATKGRLRLSALADWTASKITVSYLL